MHLADVIVCPGLGGGELDGHLGFGLDHLFNPKGFDLKAMRLIQFIDQGEFYVIALLHCEAGGQPDLGPIKEHIDQA